MKKIDNFLKAIIRLNEAIAVYNANPNNTVIRDGVIQRFEFTFELSWKAIKEYLVDQGMEKELQFPKQVLKTAYESYIISDENIWLEMVDARNATSLIYDDNTAGKIAENICSRFIVQLMALSKYFKDHC
ncbi:MAG: nucleotidyltransferase substrate binding protein [Lachnospiraceae bacterium]|nr:nucleotidyltransferase substrate binding protein [Lachnospiraceae bacterium]